MQATLTPSSATFLTQAPAAPAVQAATQTASRQSFLKDHWELKILFWGLGLIALAYPIAYGVNYAMAAYGPSLRPVGSISDRP